MRDFKIYIGIVIIAELALGCVHPQRERENKPPEITSTSDYTILPLSDTIVAVIDEEKIRKKDIDAAYREYLISLNEEDTEETRHRFMEDFIQRELVIRYARDSGVEKRDAFSSQLKRAKKNLLYEMGTALLISTITVTDDEVRVYYQEHLEEFTEPEKIEVRHILTNTKEEAEIALERIRKGDLFAVVAAQMSVHASGKTGGDLPPFSRGLYHGSFEDIAFDLKVRALSLSDRSHRRFMIHSLKRNEHTI